MVLLNISFLPWQPTLKKRNQAIFTHLLGDTGLFSEGVYIDPPKGLTEYASWRSKPFRERFSAGAREVTIVRPYFGLPFSYRPIMRDIVAEW
jgi:hypothetical protein